MYQAKQVNFSSFSSDSGAGLCNAIWKWFNDNSVGDHTLLHVAYSVAYKGKDEGGRERMYHSAIVTHVLPSS